MLVKNPITQYRAHSEMCGFVCCSFCVYGCFKHYTLRLTECQKSDIKFESVVRSVSVGKCVATLVCTMPLLYRITNRSKRIKLW